MLVTTTDAQWEGMGEEEEEEEEEEEVLSYSNCQRSTHFISKWMFRNLALQGLIIQAYILW